MNHIPRPSDALSAGTPTLISDLPGRYALHTEAVIATASTPSATPADPSVGRSSLPFPLSLESRHALEQRHGLRATVIEVRGYFDVPGTPTGRRWLRLHGFSKLQARRGSCLVAPIHDLHGRVVGYTAYPQEPRLSKDGGLVRVERPARRSHRALGAVVDVAPSSRSPLRHPDAVFCRAVWTQSAINADSAASAGLIGIGLNGTRVTTTALRRLLCGRTKEERLDCLGHLFVLDSDETESGDLTRLLRRIARLSAQEQTSFQVVYLPAGPNGEVTTLSSFLAGGGTEADLCELAQKPRRF